MYRTPPASLVAPVREEAPARLFHVYDPWTFQPYGYPPLGAKALCGHVREDGIRRSVGADHPRACIVCSDLRRGMA